MMGTLPVKVVYLFFGLAGVLAGVVVRPPLWASIVVHLNTNYYEESIKYLGS